MPIARALKKKPAAARGARRATKRATKPAPKPASKKKPAPVALPYRGAPVIKPAKISLALKPAGAIRYEVLIGSGLVGAAGEGLVRRGSRALIVVDAGLGRGLVKPLIRALDQHEVRWGVCVLQADETLKSLASLARVLTEAGRLQLERNDVVFSLGGGIVCDVAGFAAAVYRRGVRVVQCPTTLLAMVDAAVGGKTGVNLDVPGDEHKRRLVKNLVGAFHQPARVIADVASLRTLPVRELRAGLAECLKHGLLAGGQKDPGLLDWTGRNLPAILSLEPRTLIELVRRNVAIKARVVAADPHETSTKPDGGRMALNLGHTFAHAIETLPGLSWRNPDLTLAVGPLKHGEAVALGLLCACAVSEELKLAPRGLLVNMKSLIEQAGLPTRLAGLPGNEAIIARMMDDKKVDAGKLRLILPVKGGRTLVRDNVPREVVDRGLRVIREA